MTDPALTMSTQVATTLLSGGVALAVALLGIAGAIAAQLVATRRAFANSLVLFERQNAAQVRERAEEIRREDARRFAEQRRTVCARLLRDIDEQRDALAAAEQEGRALDRVREEVKSFDPDDSRVGRADIALQKLQEAADSWVRKFEALKAGVDELELLASGDVLQAARKLREVALEVAGELWAMYRLPYGSYPGLLTPWKLAAAQWQTERTNHWPAYWQAREQFVDASRRELGIPPGSYAQPQSARDTTTPR